MGHLKPPCRSRRVWRMLLWFVAPPVPPAAPTAVPGVLPPPPSAEKLLFCFAFPASARPARGLAPSSHQTVKLPIKRQETCSCFRPPARHCLRAGTKPGQEGRATAAPALPWVGFAPVSSLQTRWECELQPQLTTAKSSCASSLQESKENELFYFILLPPPLSSKGWAKWCRCLHQ